MICFKHSLYSTLHNCLYTGVEKSIPGQHRWCFELIVLISKARQTTMWNPVLQRAGIELRALDWQSVSLTVTPRWDTTCDNSTPYKREGSPKIVFVYIFRRTQPNSQSLWYFVASIKARFLMWCVVRDPPLSVPVSTVVLTGWSFVEGDPPPCVPISTS